MAEYINRELADLLLKRRAEEYSKIKADYALPVIQGDRAVIHTIAKANVRENVWGEWENIWNYDKKMGTNYNRWMCSNCGFRAMHGWEHTRAGRCPEYNYCPNCGADMRGENNG